MRRALMLLIMLGSCTPSHRVYFPQVERQYPHLIWVDIDGERYECIYKPREPLSFCSHENEQHKELSKEYTT